MTILQKLVMMDLFHSRGGFMKYNLEYKIGVELSEDEEKFFERSLNAEFLKGLLMDLNQEFMTGSESLFESEMTVKLRDKNISVKEDNYPF